MKPPGKRYRWLTAGLVVVTTIVIATRLSDREPRFEGRKLSAWLDDPTLTADEIERGVRAIGTNAIPQFQSWLVQRPSLLERSIRHLDESIDYIGLGYHPSLDANFRAMRGFFVLGELAAPAVPWLEAAAANHDANLEFYLKALTGCGPAGWEALDRLESEAGDAAPSPYLNALAFGANRSLESSRRLARYLEHPDPKIRREAYQTTRLLRERCPANLLAALEVQAIKDPDEALRQLARSFANQLAKERADNSTGATLHLEPARSPE